MQMDENEERERAQKKEKTMSELKEKITSACANHSFYCTQITTSTNIVNKFQSSQNNIALEFFFFFFWSPRLVLDRNDLSL